MARAGVLSSGQNMSSYCVVGSTVVNVKIRKGKHCLSIYQSASKAKNFKINYKKIIVFNIELFLKMNEQVGESGAKQEDKNTVQAPDLLVRRRQVYPKKPRYNLLTPDQLKDKKKAAYVQRKEKGLPSKTR